MSELLEQGIAALQAGDKMRARRLLSRAINQDPQDERGWLWLSGTMDRDEDRLQCLQQVLAINPENHAARRGVDALRRRLGEMATMADTWAGVGLPSNGQASIAGGSALDRVDDRRALGEMSEVRRRALEGFADLIAYELAHNKSRRTVVDQLTRRGYPRKAVEELVARVARQRRRR